MPISEELCAMAMAVLGMVVSIVSLLLLQKRGNQLEYANSLHSSLVANHLTWSEKSSFVLTYLNICYGTKVAHLADQYCSISEFYVKPRSLDWWNHYVSALRGDDQRFKEIFRLPMLMFQQLSQLLQERLQQGATPASLARVNGRILPVEKQVAIALLRLASGSRLIDIGEHFGVSKATVSKIIRKFVDALLEFRGHFIFWPRDSLHLEEVKRGFLLQRGLPNCCGALDVTHVNMEKPKCESGVDWFDKNKNYSMSVQCIVDMDLRFMDVFAGWPGSANDKRILRNSSFARCVEQGFYLTGPKFQHRQLTIREYVVADGGYSLCDWLMTPYVLPQTDVEKWFNFKLSSTCIVVESAFGRLKSQWCF